MYDIPTFKMRFIGCCYLQPCRRMLKQKAKQQLHLLDLMQDLSVVPERRPNAPRIIQHICIFTLKLYKSINGFQNVFLLHIFAY